MPYPELFYYKEAQSRLGYGDIPKGTLSVERMIRGQPCWTKSLPAKIKQKKLIFTDCTAKIRSKWNITKLQEELLALMDEGFSIDIWQAPDIISLSRAILSSPKTFASILNKISFAHPDEIIQAAVTQTQSTRDQVLILDDHWMRQLMQYPDVPTKRYLAASDIPTLLSEFKMDIPQADDKKRIKALIDLLKTFTPPITGIYDDEFSTIQNERVAYIKEIYPELIIERAYSKIVLDENQIISLLTEKKITISGSTLTIAEVKLAEEIEVYGSTLKCDILQKLLIESNALKSLNLSSCKSISGEFSLTLPDLKNLKYINWGSNTIKNLEHLIAASPDLHEIGISFCDLHDSNISRDNVTRMLHFAPHIKILKLNGFSDTTTHNQAKTIITDSAPRVVRLRRVRPLPISMEHLEVLDLSGWVGPSSFINNLLSITPKLNTLILSNIHQIKEICTDLKGKHFPSIETLNLSDTIIDAEDLKKILTSLPNLKILNLSGIEELVLDTKLRSLLTHIRVISTRTAVVSPLSESQSAAAAPLTSPLIDAREIPDEPLKDTASLPENSSLTPMIEASSFVDQKHTPDFAREFKPTTKDKSFHFEGLNPTKNQGMIIEKLSQYLTLTQQHLDVIPKIQDGICLALSHYFIDKPEEYHLFMGYLTEWNGEQKSLNSDLVTYFNTIYDYVREHYLKAHSQASQYLGENLISFLSSCKPGASCILKNPWHAIAVRRLVEEDSWEVYDPNYVNGPRIVAPDDLLKEINYALGGLVSIISSESIDPPLIKNADQFLEAGGLFTLCDNENTTAMVKQLSEISEYSKAALDGILLRDTEGIPAWVNALRNPSTAAYTQSLVQQFMKKNPHNYIKLLQDSMECIPQESRIELLADLIQSYKISSGLMSDTATAASLETARTTRDTLMEAIRTLSNTTSFEEQLQTWQKNIPTITTLLAYCHECVTSAEAKNRLIEFTSTADLECMQWALQYHAKNTHRPVFYIHSPEDLICSGSYVEYQTNGTGLIRQGQNGPLHQFLMTHADGKAPILIVNYEAFQTDDIIRFNTLLDTERRADGTPVPKDACIIGLTNIANPESYQESDFYSRFSQVENCPLSSEVLRKAMPDLPVTNKAADTPAANTVINLYHASDWKERLLGRWIMNRDQLTYQEGELAQAIANGGTIEIQNGLWEDKEFQRFWRQAIVTGAVANGRISIPENLNITRSEGYDWVILKSIITFKSQMTINAPVLNPSRLSEFFNHYACEGDTLVSQPGVIAQYAHNTLILQVTRSLNEDEWAMVLTACKTHHIEHIEAHLAYGVALPAVLQNTFPDLPSTAVPWDSSVSLPTQLIKSTDIDSTIAKLSTEDDTWTIIDISECSPSSLLRRIECEIKPPKFKFSESPALLTQALERGEKVLLKGRFSQELADELAPLLLERQSSARPPGRLVLVTDNPGPLNYFPLQQTHDVDTREKIALLGALGSDIIEYLESNIDIKTESLSQLKARCRYLITNPKTENSNLAWAGLDDVARNIPPIGSLDTATSESASAEYTQARLKAVEQILEHAPYVFLTGISGVGKTAFVKGELITSNDALYSSETELSDWAKDETTPGRKYLFIDEANLSNREWSEFEGLFNTPPTILINNVIHRLTPEHKVIFAGNPISFGDERHLATFFKRHGNALIFTPLTAAVVYEKIIKPIFKGTELESAAPAVSSYILKVYDFLCASSTSEVLISPRELQMMALLLCSYHKEHPEINPTEVIQHLAYQITLNLVPETKRAEFDSLFKPKTQILLAKENTSSAYLVTPSRQSIKQQLDDRLALRELRRERGGNNAFLYGGLGGIVIEGSPGIGKSDLVCATLITRGYKEMHDFEAPATDDKPFYRMPASMGLAQKERFLLNAFNEGAVVIIDEINSSPMMERLLNALLMGKTPDNKPPKHPGFMIIGTQNPVTMAGRRAASNALERRLTTIELPSYSKDEMHSILVMKGLSETLASELVASYEKQAAFAARKHLTPAPTFRDLLTLTDRIRRAHTLMPEFQTPPKDETRVEPLKEATAEKKELFKLFKEKVRAELRDDRGDDDDAPRLSLE